MFVTFVKQQFDFKQKPKEICVTCQLQSPKKSYTNVGEHFFGMWSTRGMGNKFVRIL